MAWTELHSSDGDIATAPPNFYAFDASVKTSHTRDDILALAKKHGLTNIVDYREEPPNGDYREVGVVAQATAASSLPWSLPWPLSMTDSSKVLRAWVTPPGGDNRSSTASASKTPSSGSALVLGVLAGVVIGGLAFVWWKKR